MALIKALLVLQKKIRFDYGSDEEIMERGIEMKGGTNSAIGEKSQGAVSPTVTREEGPTEQPELVELVYFSIAFPEKGALGNQFS